MKRLYLTVEGQTEQEFAVKVLQPHLAAYDVMVVKPRLTGPHGRRGRRIPQGGMFKFVHALTDMQRWMREDKSAEARFSTMIDLYSLPADFPGYEAAMAIPDCYEQIEAAEKSLAERIDDSRFVPYLQLHEFEALVLAEPMAICEWLEKSPHSIEPLIAECGEFASAEVINHGQATHPKARIKKYVEDYDENVDGPFLVEAIGLPIIRERCRHFREWLTRLEGLNEEPGPADVDTTTIL